MTDVIPPARKSRPHRRQVICSCCKQYRPHEAKGLCEACYARWWRVGFTGDGPPPPKETPHGDRHGNWRGTQATVTAKHYRIRTIRGNPTTCIWGCQDSWRYEWANLTGDYDDIWDYAPMCVRCHRRYDNARRTMEEDFTRHPWGVRGRFSADQVRELRRRAAAGTSQTALARENNCSVSTITNVIRRVSYAWVK
jgi:hypothetical protein